MKNATFRQLRFFNAVARHLSFARAAEDLHVSAPAVTMQIKELEAEVGMPLFERQGRKISLTTSGEYMLVYSRRMMALLKDAEDAAARLQRVETGSLTIGLVGTGGGTVNRGMTEFLDDGRAVVRGLQAPDVSTMIHEFGHVLRRDLYATAVLSGNRNFDGRIHPYAKQAFLASPPLVVAYAIAGTIRFDIEKDVLTVKDGKEIRLKDIWPTDEEIDAIVKSSVK